MDRKKLFIASDHAGFSLKEELVPVAENLNCEVINLGPHSSDRVDYPDFANEVCKSLKKEPGAFGLLICGSGQGMAMRANKFSHIRAALCWDMESAKLSRQHNKANVLCMGARLIEKPHIIEILKAFFNENFEGGRHEKRVDKISLPTE